MRFYIKVLKKGFKKYNLFMEIKLLKFSRSQIYVSLTWRKKPELKSLKGSNSEEPQSDQPKLRHKMYTLLMKPLYIFVINPH